MDEDLGVVAFDTLPLLGDAARWPRWLEPVRCRIGDAARPLLGDAALATFLEDCLDKRDSNALACEADAFFGVSI